MKSSTIESARPYFGRFFSAAILGAISLSMAVGLLASSAWLISMAALMPPVLTLQVAVVGVRFFGLSRGVFRYTERIWSHDAILRAASSLQLKIYRALLAKPPLSSSVMRQGRLLQQLTTDIETVQDRWIRIAIPFLGALLSGWAGIGIISWLAPEIGLAVLFLFTLAVLLIPIVVGRNSLHHSSNVFEAESRIADQVTDTCRSHLEAVIYGYENQLRDELREVELSMIRRERSVIRNSGLGSSLLLLFTYSSVVVAFLLGSRNFEAGSLAGVNIAVVTLVPLVIFDGLPALIAPLALSGKIRKATQSIDTLLTSAAVNSGSATLEGGHVEVRFVSARAKWNDEVLPHWPFSAVVDSSESLLIQGESGIGKTSLALAIAGLIDYEGSIQINGIEVREIKYEELQKSISVLLQDEHLFASSIRENLKIANSDATEEEILDALAKVELTELVESLPERLDTHIGAFGTNFSGGEKQRFRLARIFLRSTPLVILDEPFEHLRQDQAERIGLAIRKHCAEKTLIIIAHQELAQVQNRLVMHLSHELPN